MSKLPIVEFHILQSFPVCCLNRDDVGSPKIAVIGGVQRSRVSSQCWKRAIRMKMREINPTLTSSRIKHLSDLLVEKCITAEEGSPEDKIKKAAIKLADQLVAYEGIIALSQIEINELVKLLQESNYSTKIDLKSFIKNHKSGERQFATDIALFGRMIAKQQDLTVEGACAVAHAITTHRAGTELDFYTAVADNARDGDSGAGFLGISEYTAGTFYRYIYLDLQQLGVNFYGTEIPESDFSEMKNVVSDFVLALFSAVPTGRQNTMTAMCPWNYAQILVRDGQGVQVSFDTPIKANNGYLTPSIKYLKEKLQAYKTMFGEKLYGERCAIEFRDDGQTSVEDLIKSICEAF